MNPPMLCGPSPARLRSEPSTGDGMAGPRLIAGAANLLAMESTDGQGTQAEAMLFGQLMRTVQMI